MPCRPTHGGGGGYSPIQASSALIIYAGSHIDTKTVTGYDLDQLKPCLTWMLTYGELLEKKSVRQI